MENQDEFFSIEHSIPINILPLADDISPPEPIQFEKEIPAPFLIASEHSSLEATSLRNLRTLNDNNQDLINILTLQSKKIDMLMGYLLALQDEPNLRHNTTEFGASGFSYECNNPPAQGGHLQIKLFLHDESCAVYCYGQAQSSSQLANGQFLVKVAYTLIREQDREILVRATLHLQSQLLKLRSEQLLEKSKQHS